MARARNIKPGFFANESLVELPFSTRLLFIGLWTVADRAGRLEDRPKRIKMAVFPADDLDVDAALTELASAGFLIRYEASGAKFIQISAFDKHQHPHKDEKASIIPAPCGHGASPVLIPNSQGGNPADSLILRLSDPLSSSPDGDVSPAKAVDDVPAVAAPPVCPHEQIIAAFHAALPSSPRVISWTDTRRKHLSTRWREKKNRQKVEWWADLFSYAAKSKFLTGQAQSRDGRDPFVVTLDWLIKPENFAKLIEGRYHTDE